MKVATYLIPAGAGLLLLLTGCGARSGMPQFGNAATQPGPGTAAIATPPQPNAPYGLTAHSTGPYISFSLANNGPTPMNIKREHFAMIEPATRKVAPYDQHNVTIDLPRTEIGPGEVLQGRAWFKEYPAPTGNRLVYKPDAQGTYAEVTGAAGV